MAFLVDVELPCREIVTRRLADVVAQFAARLPRHFGNWCPEHVHEMVWAIKVDTFGHVGSRLLWGALGVAVAADDFCARAHQHIDEVIQEDTKAWALQPAGTPGRRHQRVFVYAEYDLEPPAGEPEIKGRMLFENGFRTVRAAERWLWHTPLPVNTWVDRSLCSEAQMMTVFCTQLKAEGLADISNDALNGVLWQFQLLFRHVELRFASGSGRGLHAWMKR